MSRKDQIQASIIATCDEIDAIGTAAINGTKSFAEAKAQMQALDLTLKGYQVQFANEEKTAKSQAAARAMFGAAGDANPYGDVHLGSSSTHLRGGGTSGVKSGGLGAAVKAAGFDLRDRPSIVLDGFATLKSNVFPAFVAQNPIPASGVYAMGRDSRFLWPSLPTIGVGDQTAISDFRQSAAALTGTVERAVDAATTKANVDVTVVSVVEALKQYAVTINSIPNAVLASMPQLESLLNGEAQFQLDKALDAAVLAQIVAATPAFGNTGTTTIDKVRNAIASMRAGGANPNVLVMNPSDAAALDLFRVGGSTTTDGPYQVDVNSGSSHPLWGMQVVERIGGGSDPMYLLDTDMLGALYLGSIRFDADPYSEFTKNLTTLRVEVNALYHVRNVAGARRIAAT